MVVEDTPRLPRCEYVDGATVEKENCTKQGALGFVYSYLKYPAITRGANVEAICI